MSCLQNHLEKKLKSHKRSLKSRKTEFYLQNMASHGKCYFEKLFQGIQIKFGQDVLIVSGYMLT